MRCPKFGCAALVKVPPLVAAKPVEIVEATVVVPANVPVQGQATVEAAVVEDPPAEEPAIIEAQVETAEIGQTNRAEASPRQSRREEEDDRETPRKSRRYDEDDRETPRQSRREDERETRRSKRRWDDDEDDLKPPVKRRKKGGLGAGVIVAFAVIGFVVLCGVGAGIYVLVNRSDDEANKFGSRNQQSGGGQDSSAKRNSFRPKGVRFNEENLREFEDPALVDEAWSPLIGKWEIFPNPLSKATCEFFTDYSVSKWVSIPGEPDFTSRKVVAHIRDRSWLAIGTGMIKKDDRHYFFTYQTPPNVIEAGSYIVYADGTMAEGGNNARYYRVGATRPDGSRNPSLEETILHQMVGQKWAQDAFEWTHQIEFRGNQTVYSKIVRKKSLLITDGKVSGIRATPTGFVVLLGKHTVNGQARESGELIGEFYYLGRALNHTLPGKEGGFNMEPVPYRP